MNITVDEAAANGRLRSRPGRSRSDGKTGLFALSTGDGPEVGLYVPASAPKDDVPVLVALHGAGGDGMRVLRRYQSLAETAGLLVLAPSSLGRTWDLVLGQVGPDVAALDRALAEVFAHYSVDVARVAVSGFSDGASYALSLGLTNGDLFTHVLAFSPGLVAPGKLCGRPRLYVSHGTIDRVLPIDYCGRPIVSSLREYGYDIRYQEFVGAHEVPDDVLKNAINWFLGAPPDF